MKLYRTTQGAFVEEEGRFYPLSTVGSVEAWDALVCDMDLEAKAMAAVGQNSVVSLDPTTILSPVGSQEVWAAGVTYYRSRKARMEESKDAGGGDFYDRVYEAPRPELFFKSTPHRVAAPGGPVRIRADSKWNVPEPELTLAINSAGKI